ncbi:MAG: LytTR family DNA-binding domain-containing protein [Saprospiraceae bacterium]|nr:LytTR family DNA-binding domain-containing protein [Saprospiraceae bacterium]
MLRTIIIDDERSSLESLEFELTNYCDDVTVVAKYNDPLLAINEIHKHTPDLLFLDIEMPGLNGFEFLQKLDNRNFDVVFVTAYDQFAIRAFEFNAIGYIMKPVRKNKLIQAVNKVRSNRDHQFDNQKLSALIQNIHVQGAGQLDRVALPTGEGYSLVKVDDITYLQAESNYTWVFIADGSKYLVAKTLKDVTTLINRTQFFRAHKSYFVNLNHVQRYIRGQGGYLVMVSGEQIPVSRSQRNDLLIKLQGI